MTIEAGHVFFTDSLLSNVFNLETQLMRLQMRIYSHTDVPTLMIASQTGSASTLAVPSEFQVTCVVMLALPKGTRHVFVRVSELSRWSWGKGRWSVLEGRHGCTWVSAGECLKRNQEESEILKLKLQIQSIYNAHGIRLNKACMQPITAVYTLQNINRVSPLLLRRESSILRKT